jgi:transposase
LASPRVDDRRLLSGIVFVVLRLRDAPRAQGPRKTLYNRWKHWGEAGVFTRIMEGIGGRWRRAEDGPDRLDRPQGAPHGIEPAGKRGIWAA